MTELTQEQIDAVEGMVSRRMENTSETRAEACEHISAYLLKVANDMDSGCACCGEPL